MNIRRLLAFILFPTIVSGDSLTCPPSSEETTAFKLKEHLLCNYDALLRPVVHHSIRTNVSFAILMKFFQLDVSSNTFSIDAWVPVFWKDQHLTWKPDDFEGIRSIHLNDFDIWTPDLSVYNSADQSSDKQIVLGSQCGISFNGAVMCVAGAHIDALCIPDLTRYPFDVQNCTVTFGSWVKKGEELNINLPSSLVNFDDVEPNGEWEITNYTQIKHPGVYKCCPNDTYPSISVSFSIQRLSGAHAATVVIPSIATTILTFTSISTSPLNKERIILCYVNFISQFMHVEYVSWLVPFRGDKIPLLLIFARDSLLMATFTIMFTIILQTVMQLKYPPPKFISTFVSCLVACRPGQFLFLKDYSLKTIAISRREEDGTSIVNSETDGQQNNTDDWEVVGKVFDKIFFLIYVVLYFFMAISFFP